MVQVLTAFVHHARFQRYLLPLRLGVVLVAEQVAQSVGCGHLRGNKGEMLQT